MSQFTQISFSDAVKKVQSLAGSRTAMQRLAEHPNKRDRLSDDIMEFVRARTSAYIATASASGQPYIQHRGGDAGFLKVVNDTTIMISERPGNRQYITQGNLDENPNAMLFLMDYANRRRVKIWGEAFISFDQNLNTIMDGPDDRTPRPVIVFKVKAWDENCPKHIPRLYGEDVIKGLADRIQDLEMGMVTMGS
ncbi:MAG: pyridoxamine 5'-phosphate oxidase family protein [Magnetovibrio sp.]|nr:pyridoxamine 5'-phosphate oxidase family protein [Magnetovibrio sp.]